MQYIDLENVLCATSWKPVAEFFESKIKQEIVDLVNNAQNITPDMCKESQARIEAYREFIVLPSTIASLNKQAEKATRP